MTGFCGVHRLARLGVAQPGFEFGDLVDRLRAPRFQLLALPQQPAPLFVGRTGILPEPAQLLVHRRDCGVGFVERGQRLLGRILTGGLLGQRAGQRRAELAHLRLRCGQLGTGLVDLRSDLQRGQLAVRTPAHPARTDQIAVERDRAQLRAGRHQIQRVAEIVDHRDTGKHGDHRAAQPRRCLDQIERPHGTAGQRGGRCGPVGRPVPQNQGRAAPVGLLECSDRGTRGAEAFGGQRVGRRPEHRGQRRFVAGPDLTNLAIGPKRPVPVWCCASQAAPSLRLEPHRERIDAGSQRSDFPFRAPLGGLQFGYAFVGQPHCGHGPLVVLVKAHFALIQFTDACLHRFEFRPGLLRAGAGLLDALGQARNAVVDRFDASPHGLHLTGQPRQTLAAVRLGSHRRQVGPVGLGGFALPIGQFGAGRVQPGARRAQLRQQPLLGGRHLIGLGFQGVGVGVAGRRRLDVEVLGAFAGDAHRRAHTSASADSPTQVCWTDSARTESSASAVSCAVSSSDATARREAASSCSRRMVASASRIASRSTCRLTRSSAASRNRASRRSAWMVWARRATSASWRPSGLS